MAKKKDEEGGNGHAQVSAHERVEHISESAQKLYDEGRGAVNDLGDYLDLRGRTRRNPYAMVAAAVGVGYVLGGGLFTPLTARILKLGVRLAALPFIKDELLSIAEGAVGDGNKRAS
jgi:hypothetical protein